MSKKMKIICSGCHTSHSITPKKFPLLLLKKVVDTTLRTGMKNVCIGFLCIKCSHKKTISDEIKKDPTLQGMGWRKAINKFLEKKKPNFKIA